MKNNESGSMSKRNASNAQVKAWEENVQALLSGDVSDVKKEKIKEDIQKYPDFRKYIQKLSKTEAHLGIFLAEARYCQADAVEPPRWALERLRGAIAGLGRKNKLGGLQWLLSCLTMPRLALVGGAAAIVLIAVVILPSKLNQPSPVVARTPGVQEILNLSPEMFVASVGSPNVARSAERVIYSPSGVTDQRDPVVLLRSSEMQKDLKLEIIAPGKPELMPFEGRLRGKSKHLSELTDKSNSLQPGEIYRIRVLSGTQMVAEETFRIKAGDMPEISSDPSHIIQAALEAVNGTPSRPGDAIAFLSKLPRGLTSDQAVIRIRYKAMVQLGVSDEAEDLKSRIR